MCIKIAIIFLIYISIILFYYFSDLLFKEYNKLLAVDFFVTVYSFLCNTQVITIAFRTF